mgnify:CR=1 FL=1
MVKKYRADNSDRGGEIVIRAYDEISAYSAAYSIYGKSVLNILLCGKRYIPEGFDDIKTAHNKFASHICG